jgi:hypothetical protein
MALHRKQLPLRTTQTIAAAASTRDAFPLYKCGVLAKDALVLITELCDDLAGNNKLLPKAELVRAFLRHAGGTPRKHEKYDGVVLKAVTALSSKVTRAACAHQFQVEQQEGVETRNVLPKRAGPPPPPHIRRLRQLAKSQAADDARPPVVLTATGLPLESETLVRVQPPRDAKPESSAGTLSIVPHPQPVRGPSCEYHPKELQWIVRKYICPKDSDHDFKGNSRHRRLRDHFIYWLEQGWVGGRKLGMRHGNQLTPEGKQHLHVAMQRFRRHFNRIEQKGWHTRLNYWDQEGRPPLLTDDERRTLCDQLHASGFDVTVEDWEEGVHEHLKKAAEANGKQDVHCVKKPHLSTVKAIMQSCDLRTDGGATRTGPISSAVQTLVRQAAGRSIRAVCALISLVFACCYFPIDPDHPRWKEFVQTMTDDDRMVCDAAGCCMIPVQASLLFNTDATSGYFELRALPPTSTFPAQRQANRVGDRDRASRSSSSGSSGSSNSGSSGSSSSGGGGGSSSSGSSSSSSSGSNGGSGGSSNTVDSDDSDSDCEVVENARLSMRVAEVDGTAGGDAVPGPTLPPCPTIGAPDRPTRAKQFDARRLAKRKPVDLPATSTGFSAQLTFCIVSRMVGPSRLSCALGGCV